MGAASQTDVIAFLERLSGRPPIETHISAVFVGPDQVWKLKKAVRLPYLDFSTLEARHKFLMRERDLNKAEAPEIYQDVVAVEPGDDGALGFRSEAESRAPKDWVLRMAPIPPADFFDAIAGRGALSAQLQDALGDCVSHSHDIRPFVANWDAAAALRVVADGCARAAMAAALPQDDVAAWRRKITSSIDRDAAWLAARVNAGFVRRCHGDLHLGNLCLWRGKPVPFDALEFDEALATIDTGYDLALLLMDLDTRASRSAANRVFNRYLARTGDVDLSRGLPLFLSLRAMVRAHVQAASGDRASSSLYFSRAHEYLRPRLPIVLAIGGLPGAGKTTLARAVAPELGPAPGAIVLRSDEIRKRAFGVAPEQRLTETAYTPPINQHVAAEMRRLTRLAIAGGHSVIADATFLNPADRQDISMAAAPTTPFVGIWLTAPAGVLEQRIASRQGDASDADLAVLKEAQSRDPGRIDWLRVDGTDRTEASTTAASATALANALAGRVT